MLEASSCTYRGKLAPKQYSEETSVSSSTVLVMSGMYSPALVGPLNPMQPFHSPPTRDAPHAMSDILLQPLNDLQTLTHTLFHSLSPSQTRPPPMPPIAAFLEADAALAEAAKLARQHQIKQRKNERLKDVFLALEERWRDVVQELERGKRELDVILTESEERIKNIEVAKTGTFRLFCPKWMHTTGACSSDTVPGTPGICAQSVVVHVCATKYARTCTWPTTSAAVLPSVPQRGEDAPRPHERRGSAWYAWRDPRCW